MNEINSDIKSVTQDPNSTNLETITFSNGSKVSRWPATLTHQDFPAGKYPMIQIDGSTKQDWLSPSDLFPDNSHLNSYIYCIEPDKMDSALKIASELATNKTTNIETDNLTGIYIVVGLRHHIESDSPNIHSHEASKEKYLLKVTAEYFHTHPEQNSLNENYLDFIKTNLGMEHQETLLLMSKIEIEPIKNCFQSTHKLIGIVDSSKEDNAHQTNDIIKKAPSVKMR